MTMKPYACHPTQSRGRRHPEAPTPYRTEFQRDRDRIVHSTAFRRLVYKTQVFLNHEGDLFRTRMTHSLEVAQLGRSIARALGLNEDLVEAIALSHDLGHTPFGHAGQDALHECMKQSGGFEHNLQSLRIVDHLEHRYPDYDGLNLSFESREGILKHCTKANATDLEQHEPPYADGRGGVGKRFLEHTQPSLEAQLCNLADEIAYNAHDVDDGLRSGLITLEQMQSVELFERFSRQARRAHPHLGQPSHQRRLMYETLRLMLSAQVHDVIDSTQQALDACGVDSCDAVRQSPPLVGFSEDMRRQSAALKKFLFQHLYRHPRVDQTMQQARQVVRDLFAAYCANPQEMQQGGGAPDGIERAVCDYIAGMTDRFAGREHERLTGQRLITPSGAVGGLHA